MHMSQWWHGSRRDEFVFPQSRHFPSHQHKKQYGYLEWVPAYLDSTAGKR